MDSVTSTEVPLSYQFGDAGTDLAISPRDRQILRRLAEQVAELAARPIERDKRELWYGHNSLLPTRPLIFCDPDDSWREAIPDSRLECEGDRARGWERALRHEVFWGTQLQDDRVIQPEFDVRHVYVDTDWGLHVTKLGGQGRGAYTWDAPLKSYDDLDKLRFSRVIVDHESTGRVLDLARETFGDLLTVRLRTSWPMIGMTWTAVLLRGATQFLLDMIDHPDGVHRLMAFLRDAYQDRLEFLEEHDLLCLNNDNAWVGSGGFGWTHDLPQPGFGGHVRTRDLWGFGDSQETTAVSPSMFAEMVFPYQLPILERYGLNCYGCCEPLDSRWHVVQRIPRLRRVSVSPWSDVGRMAELLGQQYICSLKPNPAALALANLDEDGIRASLREDLHLTRGCRVEVIMKDVRTVRNDPRRLIRWVRIAREEAEAV